VDVLVAYPQPPLDMPAARTAEWAITILGLVVMVPIVAYALYRIARHRDAVLFLALIGAAISVILEPVLSVLVHIWYPDQGGVAYLFSTFGRHIPSGYMPLFYSAFMGGFSWLICCLGQKGISSRDLFRLMGAVWALSIALETFFTGLDVYTYYGYQPLRLIEFPLWYSPINMVYAAVPAMAMYLALPVLAGWKQLLIVPLIPTVYGAGIVATMWPAASALNSEAPHWLIWVGCLASTALCVVVTWAVTTPIRKRTVERRPLVVGNATAASTTAAAAS
jgi:hypothetical protein